MINIRSSIVRMMVTNPFRNLATCILWVIFVTYIDACRIGWFGTATPHGFYYVGERGLWMAVASACFCSTIFCICPRKPLWGKALILLLMLPSLSIAVNCTISLIYSSGAS
jgi:hypothetical protein